MYMMNFSQRVALFRSEQYIAKYRPYVVAVTGTYGRTIAAQALYLAISRHRHVRMGFGIEKEKTINLLRFLTRSKIKEITEMQPDTIISEISLKYPGHAPYIALRILPRLLLVSNIGLEHIDTFGSKEMIAHEYLAVLASLADDAVVVLNADDAYIRGLKERIAHPVITYGMHANADLRLTRAHRIETSQGIFLEFVLHNVRYEAHFPNLASKQHVSAALAGLAGAHAMAIDMHSAITAIRQLQPPRGSFSLSPGIKKSSMIDDSADACPEKLESSLKSFSTLRSDGRKFVVLGDMENLSQCAIKAHEELGKQAASVASIIIFVGDMMRHAQTAVLKSCKHIDTHHFTTSAEAAMWLPHHIRQGDVVYVSGGENMNMGKILEHLKEEKI